MMANLNETPIYESGIYQIEKTDPVVGGPEGISNRPAHQLANRTAWLKAELARLLAQADALESHLDEHQKAEDPHAQYLNQTRGDARYLEKSTKAVDSARLNGVVENTNDSKNTIVKRSSYGDITARIFRSTYAEQSNAPDSNADVAFRNSVTDNCIRFMTKDALQSWLGINQQIRDAVPAGTVIAYAAAKAPSGWLECNGALLSRKTYADLFAAIGAHYGYSNSENFRLPDLRGEFVRGWDHGRGVDSGRGFGGKQGYAIQKHRHRRYYCKTDAVPYGFKQHNKFAVRLYQDHAAASGQPSHEPNCGWSGLPDSYASETRPRNLTLMYCIKY